MLLEKDIDPNIEEFNFKNWNLIIAKNDYEVLKKFEKYGLKYPIDNGYDLLVEIIKKELDLKIFRRLLKNGLWECRDSKGNSIINFVLQKCKYKYLPALLKYLYSYVDSDGNNLLHIFFSDLSSLNRNSFKIVEFMLKKGCKSDEKNFKIKN